MRDLDTALGGGGTLSLSRPAYGSLRCGDKVAGLDRHIMRQEWGFASLLGQKLRLAAAVHRNKKPA